MALRAVGWQGLEASGSFQLPHSTQAACPPQPCLTVLLCSQMSPCSRTWPCLSSTGSVGTCSSTSSCGAPTSSSTPSLWTASTGWWPLLSVSRQVQPGDPVLCHPGGLSVPHEPVESYGKVLLWQLPGLSLFKINHNHMKMENEHLPCRGSQGCADGERGSAEARKK